MTGVSPEEDRAAGVAGKELSALLSIPPAVAPRQFRSRV